MHREPGSRRISVTLPPAPPASYLEWLAWWSHVERTASQDRVLETVLVSPMLRQRPRPRTWRRAMALWLSGSIGRQALSASRSDAFASTPVVTGPRPMLDEAVGLLDTLARFVRWWSQDPLAAEAVGIARPSSRVELLHAEVVDRMRGELDPNVIVIPSAPDEHVGRRLAVVKR